MGEILKLMFQQFQKGFKILYILNKNLLNFNNFLMNQSIQLYHRNQSRKGGSRRTDPKKRLYVCSCQKSYESYTALWSHIHLKHEGKVNQEEIIRPAKDLLKKRIGRKLNQNELNFIYGEKNSKKIGKKEEHILQNFSQLINEDKRFKAIFCTNIKQLYENDPFYKIYLCFDTSSLRPPYNQEKQIFQENSQNVLCEFLYKVSDYFKVNFYKGLAAIFVIILAKGVMQSKKGGLEVLKQEPAEKLVTHSNFTYMNVYEEAKQNQLLQNVNCFKEETMGKLMQLFYAWVGLKKYSTQKVKINYDYFIDSDLD